MKHIRGYFVKSALLLLLGIALLLSTGNIMGNKAHASTVFPGIYPSLTYNGAQSYQQQVNNGQQTWLLNPAQTSLRLAEQLLSWPNNSTTSIQSGGGIHDSSASVIVYNKAVDRGSITVTLARLDGNTNGGIWIVTGVTSPNRSISNPQAYDTLPQTSTNAGGATPYTVTGTGPGFEGVIGTVYLYDSSYGTITTASANGSLTFSAPLIYSTSSTGDALVALYTYGAANGGINGAVLVKVTIG